MPRTKPEEFVRNPYNYDADQVSDETGLHCPEQTLTSQEFIEESDINYIANRFMSTGEIPVVRHFPTSGDFEGIFDFQDAMNLITDAKQKFMKLPAKVRSRFDNDPAKLITFLESDKEEDRVESIALGLREKPTIDAAPAPVDKPATPPSVEPAPSK